MWCQDRECEDQDGGHDEDPISLTASSTETQKEGVGAFDLHLVSSDLMNVSVVAHHGKWGLRIETRLALYDVHTAQDAFEFDDVRILVNLVAYYSEGKVIPWTKREEMRTKLEEIHHTFLASLVQPYYALKADYGTAKLTSNVLDQLHETVRSKTL